VWHVCGRLRSRDLRSREKTRSREVQMQQWKASSRQEQEKWTDAGCDARTAAWQHTPQESQPATSHQVTLCHGAQRRHNGAYAGVKARGGEGRALGVKGVGHGVHKGGVHAPEDLQAAGRAGFGAQVWGLGLGEQGVGVGSRLAAGTEAVAECSAKALEGKAS